MYNLKNEANMYIENYDFKEWMQKLFDKLDELCKDVRVLRNAGKVMPEDDNLLDNQNLCLLFKVSIRTLQRLRSKNELPYMLISEKVYYRLRMSGSLSRNGLMRSCSVTLKSSSGKRSKTDKPEWWVSLAPALSFLWFP